MNAGAESAQTTLSNNEDVRLEPRRLADYVVDKDDRGRNRLWMISWLAVGPLFRSGIGGHRLRSNILRAFGTRVGSKCMMHRSLRVHYPWKLVLGDHVQIAAGVWMINPEPVVIGAHCRIGRDVVICAGGHDHTSPTFTRTSQAIVIGDRCTIGAGATVLKGVTMPPNSHIRDPAVVIAGNSEHQRGTL